jgi:D-Tyr-tRNAtyr deacylase
LRFVEKLLKLRIFADDAGKMNRSVKDVGGGLLMVSQFTLAADVSGGNRPSSPARPAPTSGVRFTRRCCAWRESVTRRLPPVNSVPTCRST